MLRRSWSPQHSCVGGDIIGKLLEMQLLDENDELANSSDAGGDAKEQQEADGRPTCMRTLVNALCSDASQQLLTRQQQ